MSETAAERALMAERHDDGDGRNATWHMSVNRMGSMLAAIRNEARAGALDVVEALKRAEAIEVLDYYEDGGSNAFNYDRYREDVVRAALDAEREDGS